MKNILYGITAYLLLMSMLSGCDRRNMDYSYPKAAKEIREENVGSLFGESTSKEGLVIFSGRKKQNSTLAINKLLWESALETLSFMPLVSVDSNSGIIITDWYEDPKAPKERFKVNVFIQGQELQVNALRVTIFKQVLGHDNMWHSAIANDNIRRDLEEKILFTARQKKVMSNSK
jgi:hypothetical protein